MKLTEDADRFSKLSEGWHHILLAAALIAGGIFAAYEFRALRKQELANLEYEQKKERRPISAIELRAEVLDAEVDDYTTSKINVRKGLFIHAQVTLKNTGNFPTLIDLSHADHGLFVARLNSDTSSAATLTGPRRFLPLATSKPELKFYLAPGNTTQLSYLAEVQFSGIHAIEFRMPQDPRGVDLTAQADPKSVPIAISATTFQFVSKDRKLPLSAPAQSPASRRLKAGSPGTKQK